MVSIPQLLIFGLLAAAGNLLGGFLIVKSKQDRGPLISLVAIGAGFMLATIFSKSFPNLLPSVKPTRSEPCGGSSPVIFSPSS